MGSLPPGFRPSQVGGLGFLHVANPLLAELLMRSLEMKGDLPEYIERKFDASVQIADFTAPEYWYLARLHKYCQSITVAAGGAGTIAQCALGISDADQNRDTLAEVYRVIFVNNSAGALGYFYGLSSSANVAPTAFGVTQDDRALTPTGVLNTSRYQVGQSNINLTNPLGGQGGLVFVPANSSYTLDVSYTLTNKRGASGNLKFYIVALTAVTPCNCTIHWKERPLLTSELT